MSYRNRIRFRGLNEKTNTKNSLLFYLSLFCSFHRLNWKGFSKGPFALGATIDDGSGISSSLRLKGFYLFSLFSPPRQFPRLSVFAMISFYQETENWNSIFCGFSLSIVWCSETFIYSCEILNPLSEKVAEIERPQIILTWSNLPWKPFSFSVENQFALASLHTCF